LQAFFYIDKPSFLFQMEVCGSASVLDVIQTGSCTSESKNAEIEFHWLLLQLDCMEELYRMQTQVKSCRTGLIGLSLYYSSCDLQMFAFCLYYL